MGSRDDVRARAGIRRRIARRCRRLSAGSTIHYVVQPPVAVSAQQWLSAEGVDEVVLTKCCTLTVGLA